MDHSPHDVTQMLHDWGEGDQGAAERLMPLVYDELRKLARAYLRRERADHTLQPTALVNEAYLKLVDHARSHAAEKRGGLRHKLSLDEANVLPAERALDLIELDDALRRLSEVFPRKGQVIELRFFGGLSVEETAHVLGVSDKTVMREWQSAKLWLYRELDREGAEAEPK